MKHCACLNPCLIEPRRRCRIYYVPALGFSHSRQSPARRPSSSTNKKSPLAQETRALSTDLACATNHQKGQITIHLEAVKRLVRWRSAPLISPSRQHLARLDSCTSCTPPPSPPRPHPHSYSSRVPRTSSYLPARLPNFPCLPANVSSSQRPVKMRIKADCELDDQCKKIPVRHTLIRIRLRAQLCRPTSTVGTAASTTSLVLGQSFPTSTKQCRRLCCFVRLLGATSRLLDPCWRKLNASYKAIAAV